MEVEPDPAPIPGRFKSWAQLRAWAARRFPRATLVTEGLDLKAWNRIAPILDSLASDWPGVARELGWITTRHAFWEEKPKGALAAAESISGEKIAFNPYYFRSAGRIRRVLRRGERRGFYPRGASGEPEHYLLSHEWAHLVAAWLQRHDRERWSKIVALFVRDPEDPASQLDLAKAGTISRNAELGMAEAFADAFSASRWQSERLRSRIVKHLLQIL